LYHLKRADASGSEQIVLDLAKPSILICLGALAAAAIDPKLVALPAATAARALTGRMLEDGGVLANSPFLFSATFVSAAGGFRAGP
jgi:hypothetical protein